MCIFIAKKRGFTLPSLDTLKNCFVRNSDGAGLAYVKNKEVIIKKGFMTWETFKAFILELSNIVDVVNTPIIIHFRYATHGGIQRRLTHPFPMSRNKEKLDALSVKCSCAIVHNGIIPGRAYDNDVDSDTYLYIQKVISKLKLSDIGKKRWLDKLAKNTGSKWAFLTKDGQIYTAGDLVEEDGILYSNTGYKGWGNTKWYNNWVNDMSLNSGWGTGYEDDDAAYEDEVSNEFVAALGGNITTIPNDDVDWDRADRVLGAPLVNDILAMGLSIETANTIINLATERIERKYAKYHEWL